MGAAPIHDDVVKIPVVVVKCEQLHWVLTSVKDPEFFRLWKEPNLENTGRGPQVIF